MEKGREQDKGMLLRYIMTDFIFIYYVGIMVTMVVKLLFLYPK